MTGTRKVCSHSLGLIGAMLLCANVGPVAGKDTLSVGFDAVDITPDVGGERPVWLAGYGWGRRATGVHDPLFARTVTLNDGKRRIALVSVDLVGLQLPEVELIRSRLSEFDHVMVASTHNHEGPDTIGMWGRTPLHRGVDPDYLNLVVRRTVESVRRAESRSAPCTARYGTAQADRLIGDSRKPVAKDGVLRVLKFHDSSTDRLAGILVQWNCHPESLGPRNTLVTADFCYATIRQLNQQYNCPVAYFSGAVGGLMAPPDHLFKDEQGRELREGQYEYAEAYGNAVARLATQAILGAEPIRLTPFHISRAPVAIPIRNPLYRAARVVGVLKRKAVQWTGNFRDTDLPPQPASETAVAIRSEVSCFRLGDLVVLCVPGEIYPELVYGEFQEPAEPNVDFPDAPLESPIVDMLAPNQKWMLFGLANDEIGYIIPTRQWDQQPPYAYGRTQSQYGEINSCGVDVAPIIMASIQERLDELAN